MSLITISDLYVKNIILVLSVLHRGGPDSATWHGGLDSAYMAWWSTDPSQHTWWSRLRNMAWWSRLRWSSMVETSATFKTGWWYEARWSSEVEPIREFRALVVRSPVVERSRDHPGIPESGSKKRSDQSNIIGKVLIVRHAEFFPDAGTGHFNAFDGLPCKGGYFTGIHVEPDK